MLSDVPISVSLKKKIVVHQTGHSNRNDIYIMYNYMAMSRREKKSQNVDSNYRLHESVRKTQRNH